MPLDIRGVAYVVQQLLAPEGQYDTDLAGLVVYQAFHTHSGRLGRLRLLTACCIDNMLFCASVK